MKNSLQNIRSIEDFELKDKKVFLRLDLNVPMKNGKITDSTRIEAALPTIRYALDHGAKLIMASHFGRPEGLPTDREKYTLEPVAEELGRLLDKEVILVDDPKSDAPKALLPTLRPNQVVLLENLRFHPDETENGEGLAKAIAAYTDIYINDAFGASHRAHASIVGVPQYVQQKGVGFLMKKELEMLDKVSQNPDSPYVVILGGAKVSDKIGVIENLIDKADAILIGGAMAYTFLAAQKVETGKSLVEKDKVKYAAELIARMESRGKKLLLPIDHFVVTDIKKVDTLKTATTPSINAQDIGIDIGPKTAELYRKEIAKAKTVFWNGPMGIFETPEFAKGTFAVAKALAESEAITIVGGGDSAAAINASGYGDQVTHISTGGGASLEFLQGDKLPGVEAVRKHVPTT
ncbi:MAG: phosphoglycerate kinase [Bdellovibrionota bacterium]